uniref:Protein kinase domain-containing protein n=1 Tax=Kalanchoe fedtschenkoi TaxID=63787 RepID=A0A7N0TGZ9_KALFE
MPRPLDGKLRYVGGETRIVSVLRNVSYEELMRRMREIYEGATVLKYQQPDEDLDALVSVVNDEDVTNMMEEYDKLGSGDGFYKLRIFLFSPLDEDADPHVIHGNDGDRRYVDALNSVNEASDYWRPQWNDSPHWYDSPRTSSADASEPYLPLGLEGGYPSPRNYEMLPRLSVHHHMSPRYNSNQLPAGPMFNDMESPWGQACYSPGHQGYIDFPSPTSSVRYNMPYGEYPDNRMTGDYRFQQVVQQPVFEQMPRYPENVLWVPTGTLTNHQAGFPVNILQGTHVIEGNGTCDLYQMPFQRSKPELGHSDVVNGFQQTSSPAAGCPPHSEHGRMLHDQLDTRVEETYLPEARRLSDTYKIESSAMNYPVARGYQVASNYANHLEDPQYIQARTGVQFQVTPNPVISSRSHVCSPAPDGRPSYYENLPYNYPAENHCRAHHSNILQRNNQSYAQGDGEPQGNGNVNPVYPIYSENIRPYPVQVNDTENLPDSLQEVVCLDTSYMLEYPHGNSLKLNTKVGSNSSGRPPVVPPRSDMPNLSNITEASEMPSSVPVLDKLDSPVTLSSELDRRDNSNLERGKKGGVQVEDNIITPAHVVEGKDTQGYSCTKQKVGGLEQEMKTADSVQYDCLQSMEKYRDNIMQNAEASANRVNALSKSESLPMAETNVEEMKRLPEASDVQLYNSKTKEDSAKEMENLSSHLDIEWNSENENICKIEPTKAEAEAIARGLQTIKTADLEEIRELGSGTYGSVYHGKWKGSDVAIKRIKASCFAGKPSERERLIAEFWNEALLLSSLHHPNVVSFYGIVRDGPDGSLATVTEFMINGSLKQFLKKKDRTIDRRKRLIIAMDAAFGMEYLHGKNIVHFDLKCENLLVNMRDPQRPICKIGDLGLSKVKQRTLVSGGIRGTLPWMAPELLSGKNNMVSEKIDVYSFGVVMWELLTGAEPYADMHYGSIIGGIVNNALRPQIPTWCDPEWKSLMESCWASDPAERPSFSEISQKLRSMATAMNIK